MIVYQDQDKCTSLQNAIRLCHTSTDCHHNPVEHRESRVLGKEVRDGVNIVKGMILHVSTRHLQLYDMVWRCLLHEAQLVDNFIVGCCDGI